MYDPTDPHDPMFGVLDGPSMAELEEMRTTCEASHLGQAQAMAAAVVDNACGCFNQFGAWRVGRLVAIVEVVDELGESHLAVVESPGLQPFERNGLLHEVTY